MIRALKHLADLGMSRPLAELMRRHAPDWLETEHFDFVLPVPLSKERRLYRGFNQSEELADILSEHYGWTLLLPRQTVFRRHREPQSTLKSANKVRNILPRMKFQPEDVVVLTVSGRGDKDISTYLAHKAEILGE